MPFRKWTVEPVFLSRKPLPPDKGTGEEFEATVNGSLVKSLKQLACVVKLADRIFEEIGSECRLVLERTERLKVKVQVCEDAVARLDAKTVEVPVSDLGRATHLLRRQQYATYYEQSSQIFLPATRPPCVDKLYSSACVTPVALICTIDRYRNDGCTGSQMFMVTPVLGDAKRKKRKMLDIETRRPASFALARDWQENVEFGLSTTTSVLSQHLAPSIGRGTLRSLAEDLDRLPSPEEQAMALSLEYPSAVVPVDITGSSFLRMTKFRRSLIHADFVIKRKKTKRKNKRRHTVCEGSSKELEEAVQSISMVHTSCQTDDVPDVSSLSSLRRSFSRRRGRTVMDNIRRETVAVDGLDSAALKRMSKSSISAEMDEKDEPASKENSTNKKSSKPSLKSRACSFNPISSLSAALSVAVKMRQSSRTAGKTDDGRSSSGNWSGSSSTRASVDSDQQQAVASRDGARSQSRNSLGKDSVLSDATQQDTDGRSQDDVLVGHSTQFLTKYPVENQDSQAKTSHQWVYDADQGRHSSTSTPERNASDTTSTPLVLSPYLGRRAHPSPHPFPGVLDDGESSVYSVDTDGYYTSMHTDSGLWSKSVQASKSGESVNPDSFRYRRRQESQSSVSTIGNNSLNSFLSRTATEGSSNQGSLKKEKPPPAPPPRVSSVKSSSVEREPEEDKQVAKERETEESDKSDSPPPGHHGSNSESDFEVQDRIRVKTTINSSRYPSMCAVSPETTDDETEGAVDDRYKTVKSSNINIVVAEIHREDSAQDVLPELVDKCKAPNVVNSVKTESTKQSVDLIDHLDSQQDEVFYAKGEASNGCSSVINMYGNQTPVPSTFSSSLLKSDSVEFSSPIPSSPVTTFSPDSLEGKPKHSPSNNTVDNSKHVPISLPIQEGGQKKGLVVTSHPVSPQQLSPDVEKTLIPLKYAQHITVTPIPRTESVSSPEFTPTKFTDYPFPRSLRNNLQSSYSASPAQMNASRTKEFNSNSVSAYTPFRISSLPMSTDYMKYSTTPPSKSQPFNSPVTTVNYPVKPTVSLPIEKPLSPTRSVARVTLDPAGKVVFSSSSLGRTRDSHPLDTTEKQENIEKPCYATFPKYQTRNTEPLVTTENKNSSAQLSHISSSDSWCQRRAPPVSTVSEQHKTQVQNTNELVNSNGSLTSGLPEHLSSPSSCQIIDYNHSTMKHGATPPPQAFSGANSTTGGKEPYFRPTRGGRFCRTYFPAHLISSPSQQPDPIEQRPPGPPSPSGSFRSDSSSSSHSSSYTKLPPVYSSTFTSPLKHTSISEKLAQQRNFNMQRRTFPTSTSCPTSLSPNSQERTNAATHSDHRFRLSAPQGTYSSLQPVDQKGTNSVSYSHNRFSSNFSHYQPNNNYQVSSSNQLLQMNTPGVRPATPLQTSPVNSKSSFPLEARNAYNASSATNYSNSKSSSIYPTSQSSSLNIIYDSQNPVFITDASQKVQDRNSKVHSSFVSSQPPDVVPSSALPPSTLDVTKSSTPSPNLNQARESECRSLTNCSSTPLFNKQPQQKQSLSAGELFAIIHSSKKKHNIKTESEKSLSPLSSRSSSPGVGQTPSRGFVVETGFLSKRNSSLLTPGDRHSWGSNLSLPSERKNLVQDRLGKAKPTSMHDFKMLLLQTRGGSSESNRRLSAAELLRVSPPKKSDLNNPNLSSQSLPSSPIKSAMLVQSPSSTGHSTVPLKRSIRTKSPYRYDSAYPPIWEDCSEDIESTSDTDRYLRSSNSSNSSVFPRNERNSQSCNVTNSELHKPASKATSTWV